MEKQGELSARWIVILIFFILLMILVFMMVKNILKSGGFYG